MAIIRLNGSAESETGQFILPVDGAAGIYFTNESQKKLTNNFAKNALSAAIIGSLSPTADYTSMSLNTGYVQTSIKETSDMTIIAVYEQPTTVENSAMIASTYKGDPTAFGIGLYANQGVVKFLATQRASNGNTTSGGRETPASGWTMAVGKVSGATNSVQNLTTGTNVSTTYASRVLGDDPQKIRIGASYEQGFTSSLKIMAVVIFDKALSDNETDAVADVLRRYAAKHNVTV